jgi:four helix bundle protein
MHNYKELNIWKNSLAIAIDVYYLSADFPKEENFGLTSQIRRSAVTVPSNIAEGSSRSSNKDFNRFLEIAMGSSFELQTQLEISKTVLKIDADKADKLNNEITENQKMIRGFMQKIQQELK